MFSKSGDVQYIGEYHEYIEGYHEYIRGMMHVGDIISTSLDIMSTSRDVQYIGLFHDACGGAI